MASLTMILLVLLVAVLLLGIVPGPLMAACLQAIKTALTT